MLQGDFLFDAGCWLLVTASPAETLVKVGLLETSN